MRNTTESNDDGPSDRIRLAYKNQPSELYKFFRYGNADYHRRIERLLVDGEIYFSTRAELNDPFELRVKLQPPSNRRAAIKALKKGAFRGGMRNKASWKEIAEVQRRVERVDIATSYKKLEMNHNQRMEESCFVLCMSARRKNSLMWSHYADGHKGLCIHFSTRVIPIAGACAVQYQRKYPVAMFPAEEQSSAEDLFFKSVLTIMAMELREGISTIQRSHGRTGQLVVAGSLLDRRAQSAPAAKRCYWHHAWCLYAGARAPGVDSVVSRQAAGYQDRIGAHLRFALLVGI
jgi:hypothetical protein